MTLATASGGVFKLHFGVPSPGTPGISFSQSITVPSGFSGDTQWVQIVTGTTRTRQPNSGALLTLQGSGVDTNYPYDTSSSTEDSPGSGLSPCDYTAISADDSFTMWLMFKPTGTPGTAIFVPLRKVSWNWSGSGSRSGGSCGWVLGSSNKAVGSASDATDFPVWTTNIIQFTFH